MEGRIVTNQQAQELQGVFIDADTFFNFVQDIIEFMAYDDFVLELVLHKIYPNNFKKKIT